MQYSIGMIDFITISAKMYKNQHTLELRDKHLNWYHIGGNMGLDSHCDYNEGFRPSFKIQTDYILEKIQKKLVR